MEVKEKPIPKDEPAAPAATDADQGWNDCLKKFAIAINYFFLFLLFGCQR